MRTEVHASAGMHVASDRTVISETGDRYAITGYADPRAAGLFQDLKSIPRRAAGRRDRGAARDIPR